jgi:hypothetical protein
MAKTLTPGPARVRPSTRFTQRVKMGVTKKHFEGHVTAAKNQAQID